MYVLLLLVVLLLILLTWTDMQDVMKAMLIFVIGYYVGKHFSYGANPSLVLTWQKALGERYEDNDRDTSKAKLVMIEPEPEAEEAEE